MGIFDEVKKIFNPYEDEDDYMDDYEDQDTSPFLEDRTQRDRDRGRDRDRRCAVAVDARRG